MLAISSLSWTAAAPASSRPHYGGTLRIATRQSPPSIEPGSTSASSITALVFEALVSLDDHGRPQPGLARSWQAEPGNQRWRFTLRGGVSFSDGSPLDANTAAASLRAANADWKVIAAGDTVMIETASPRPHLPAELALPSNAIVRHESTKPLGTGPFVISQFDPGKHVSLKANDQYWNGRPFLDSVEIDLGKNPRDQLSMYDLGKTDAIEIAPESIHRAEADGRNVLISDASNLIALVFAAPPKSDDEAHARAALGTSIDTAAISHVVLQDGAEPTGALLPNWISGYSFIFPAGRNIEVARHEKAMARRLAPWTLGYDSSDAVSRVIAERIQLNARDIGLTIQLAISGATDLRLVRVSIPSPDPSVALSEVAQALQRPEPKRTGATAAEVYSAEKMLLETHQVVPLLHVKSAVSIRANVHGWKSSRWGEWRLENVWLGAEKP